MPNISRRLLYFIILSVCIILLFIAFLVLVFLRNSNRQGKGENTPVISVAVPTRSAIIVPITAIPRQEGQKNAIDTTSPTVTSSQEEIKKFSTVLPYTKDITLSTGQTVSVVIPGPELQDDPWKLTTQIFNINYQVLPSEPDYALQKASFIEAANDVFAWIRSYGADPQRIIFKWGDEAFIQNRAEEWLK